jgi:hypothetical protein
MQPTFCSNFKFKKKLPYLIPCYKAMDALHVTHLVCAGKFELLSSFCTFSAQHLFLYLSSMKAGSQRHFLSVLMALHALTKLISSVLFSLLSNSIFKPNKQSLLLRDAPSYSLPVVNTCNSLSLAYIVT